MMIPGPSSPIPELAGTRTPFTVSPPAFHHVRNPAAIISILPSMILSANHQQRAEQGREPEAAAGRPVHGALLRGGRVDGRTQDADVRQVPVALVIIQAVANDKAV